MKGAAQLFIEVVDNDVGDEDRNDHVDDIYAEISRSPNKQFTSEMHFNGEFGNSRISLNFRVMCSSNYYGSDCATYCLARDDHLGHYTCDSTSGAKICLQGWSGVDCLDRK